MGKKLLFCDQRIFVIDPMKLGAPSYSEGDIIRTHAVGAAILTLSNHLSASRSANLRHPDLVAGSSGFRLVDDEEDQIGDAYTGLRRPFRDLIIPRVVDDVDALVGLVLNRPHIRDMSFDAIGMLEVAMGVSLTGNQNPINGRRFLAKDAEGQRFVVFNGREYIDPNSWTGAAQMPTLAAMVRDRRFCAAITALHIRSPLSGWFAGRWAGMGTSLIRRDEFYHGDYTNITRRAEKEVDLLLA